MSLQITLAFGKLAAKLFAASVSISKAKPISKPDWAKPALVPPHPEKKSKTLIFLFIYCSDKPRTCFLISSRTSTTFESSSGTVANILCWQ
jgi:hypothetical protein